MKRKRLSFVCILLCMSLLIMPVPASATNQTATVDEIAAKSMAQAPALEAFNEIYDLVIFDTAETSEYHDYYSGSYINDENVLVICVKKDGDALVNMINNALGDEYEVDYEFCDWSKNEVLAFAKSEMSTLSSKATVTVNSGYYSAQDNAYILEVTNTSEEPVLSSAAKRDSGIPVVIREVEVNQPIVCDNSDLEYEQTVTTTAVYTPIYGGMAMQLRCYHNNTYVPYIDGATIALCGYFNGEPCVLTAAHCCMDTDDTQKDLYMDYNFTVHLEETSLQVRGTGDYAALKIPSGYIATNNIKTSSSGNVSPIAGYSTSLEIPENTIIYKYGAATELTASKVISSTGSTGSYPDEVSPLFVSIPVYAEEYENNPHNHDPIADPGDSGGPVWTLNTQGGVIIVGIVQAKSNPTTDITVANKLYTTPIRFPLLAGFIPYGMVN